MTLKHLVALVVAAAVSVGLGIARAQDQPSAVTEIEQLRLDNATLRAQLGDAQESLGRCQGQLGPLIGSLNKQQAEEKVKAAVEKMESARPGWAYDVRTGQWTKKGAAPQ